MTVLKNKNNSRSIKLMHFADVHGEDKNHDEIKKCVDFTVLRTRDEKPDAIICSGDIINSKYLQADSKSLKYMSSYFRELSNIAPVAVIIGTDTHEGRISETLINVAGEFPIHVSTTAEQIYLVRGLKKTSWYTEKNIATIKNFLVSLVISQIPPPTKENWKHRQGVEKDNENISNAIGSIFTGFGVMAEQYPNAIHILNGHFSVQGCKISDTQLLPGADISIGVDTLSMANAAAYMLGHIHHHQQIGDNIFYAGSIFRKNFGEKDSDKGFMIYNIQETQSDD